VLLYKYKEELTFQIQYDELNKPSPINKGTAKNILSHKLQLPTTKSEATQRRVLSIAFIKFFNIKKN
jgi:hypothetical protein